MRRGRVARRIVTAARPGFRSPPKTWHRYFLYAAIIFLGIPLVTTRLRLFGLTRRRVSISDRHRLARVLANIVLLSGYTLSCHR